MPVGKCGPLAAARQFCNYRKSRRRFYYSTRASFLRGRKLERNWKYWHCLIKSKSISNRHLDRFIILSFYESFNDSIVGRNPQLFL